MRRTLATLFLLLILASPAFAQLPAGTQGDLLYRGLTGWAVFHGGTAGQILQSNGPTASPSWSNGYGTYTTFAFAYPAIATNRVMGNNTGANAAPAPITASQLLDTIGYDTARPPQPGSILVKTATPGTWQAIPVPTPFGWVLTTTGPQSPPDWAPLGSIVAPGAAGTCLVSNGTTSTPSYQACVSAAALSATVPLTFTPGTPGVIALAYDSNFSTAASQLSLAVIGSGQLIANSTAGSLEPTATTLTALIDRAIGSTSATFLQRNASWVANTMSGDATLSAAGALTLASVISASSAGSATSIPVITWDAKGRLTTVSTATPTVTSVNGVSYPSSYTSGGVPYASGTSTILSSALLAANQIVLGGGAATAPATLGSLGTTSTVLHGNAAGAPSFASVALSDLATQATNTVLGNATSGTAVPTALAVGTCSTTASALIWTTNTGFGCNTAIVASSATTATTATNATNTAVTDDTTTNATMYPTWVTAATGNLPQKLSSTKLTFNPSTGALTATNHIGTFAGNTFTTGTGVLTIAAAKTLTVSNTITASATDGTTLNLNGGSTFNAVKTVATGAKTLATSAISSATCSSAQTATATGTLGSDIVDASFNGDPTGATGYVPLTTGMLTIISYPTADTVNFKVCNNTSASITPGAVTLNWAVRR